jgi:Rrf2 family transcriptional regulator, iron-sulfur cluster assembly transcription factor
MRISTKGRFAVTAMIDLALREALGPVTLTDIASRQHISLSYLEQLFSKLRQHVLVTSIRGPGGGYLIGSQIDGITVTDIVCAVEDASPKAKHTDASSVQSKTQELWDAMHSKVLDFTNTVTLKSLVHDQLALGVKIEQFSSHRRGVLQKTVQLPMHPNVPNSVFALGRTSQMHG